jgi:hypothetical protein
VKIQDDAKKAELEYYQKVTKEMNEALRVITDGNKNTYDGMRK